jgi:hypothetical protein
MGSFQLERRELGSHFRIQPFLGAPGMSVGFPSNPQFAPQFPQNPPPRKSGFTWLISLLLVFVGMMFLGGVLLVGGIWYVTANLDRWLVGFGREAIVAMIQESEIPAQEKTEVIEQIDRVVTAYKERKINQDDLNRVLTELQESPALTVVSLYGIDDDYLTTSRLTRPLGRSIRSTRTRMPSPSR